MEKDRIEFSITSLEPGGNSEPNGNVQIFFYINTICVFSKTIWRKNSRSEMKKGRITFSISFLEPGENSVQNVPVQLFLLHIILKLRIFQDHLKKRYSPMETDGLTGLT